MLLYVLPNAHDNQTYMPRADTGRNAGVRLGNVGLLRLDEKLQNGQHDANHGGGDGDEVGHDVGPFNGGWSRGTFPEFIGTFSVRLSPPAPRDAARDRRGTPPDQGRSTQTSPDRTRAG